MAREPADHILNGLGQVAALLPDADQEMIKLLSAAEHTQVRQDGCFSTFMERVVKGAVEPRPFSSLRDASTLKKDPPEDVPR